MLYTVPTHFSEAPDASTTQTIAIQLSTSLVNPRSEAGRLQEMKSLNLRQVLSLIKSSAQSFFND